MHELGIIMNIVDQVEKVAAENEVTKIQTLVLQIGELSSVIPKYVEDLYPVAIDGTMLEGSQLEIEILPANGRCQKCGYIFNLVEEDGVCPNCKSTDCDMLGGRELYIKEIVCC